MKKERKKTKKKNQIWGEKEKKRKSFKKFKNNFKKKRSFF